MICTDNLKPNSAFVIESIKQSNQDVLRRKLEKGALIDINNFIANIKRNDAESPNYIFKLVRQIDLTEKLKRSYPQYLGDFIWNIFDDSLLSERYSQIINSFELTGNIITSDLKDFNHFLWALFQISKELPEIFFGENILENRLDKKGSIGEKLRLIGIFRSADHTLTNRIVRIKTLELRSVITESEEELRNWFEEHIDSPKRNPFSVALALKGALTFDANWVFPFIRANFKVERVIKCLEEAEAKNEKSESLINGIVGWLNEAKSKAFADIDRAESYYWEGETYLRLKKFGAAKGSFSGAEELFLNSNNRERAFDAAYRHIYVYILEEEEKEWIDYESYFNFLEGFLERYKDLTTKEYPIHEKRIEYYKNKSKYYYKKGDFDTACKFSKEAYEYAERIYEKYPTRDFKRVIRLNKAFYWRAKANLLKIGRLPDHRKIAVYYEKAARNSEKRERYMDLANCYKHKAIAVKKEINPEKFFENIAKSIECETKLGVKEVKNYLDDLKNERLLVFQFIDNLAIASLAKSMDDFLEIAKEPDKIWEFLLLIVQSEKTVYYYREGNKDTSKVSREAYEYAKELYEKYPSEDIECLISLNNAFYWRTTAEIWQEEQLIDNFRIAKAYEKAAQASEKYDEKASYNDWAERYRYKAFAFHDEPEEYLENISKAIEFAFKVGVKITQDLKRLKQGYIHSRSAVQNYFEDGDFEKTRKFSREIFEYVEKTYGKNPKEWDIKRIISFNKAIYWRATAEILKGERLERDNLGIAGHYKEAAQFSEKYDEKESYKDWGNHFKYRALAFKSNPEKLLKSISKAIEYATKAGDEEAKNYLENLKHDRLFAFSRMGDFEKRISNLKIAKDICHKSGDTKSGKLCEFLISLLYSYNQLEKATTDEEIKKALSSFEKLIKRAEKEDIKFPYLSISKEALEAEKHKLEGEIWWSRGNFSKASESFKEWLRSEVAKKEADERELKSYEILERCSDILSKEDIYSKQEFIKAQSDLSKYLDKQLSKKIFNVVNLLLSRISSHLGGFLDEEFLEKNKMEIIKVLSRKKIIEELEFDQKLEDATKEILWLYELPEDVFGKTFDKKMHDLEGRINRGESVGGVINDFEILLLERYVKIITEFNAKILWKKQWKGYVEKYLENIGRRGKDFYSASFGDYFEILRLIREVGIKRSEFYYNIKEKILNLLEKHVNIRNDIAHGREVLFEGKNDAIKLKNEILKIMYSLLQFFPLCLRVETGPFYGSWYKTTLLWGKLSRAVDIEFEEENLNKSEIYYIDRASFSEEQRQIEPEVVTTATFLKEFLGIENDFQELIPVEIPEEIPKDATGWLKKASHFYKLRNYEETIRCLDECLKLEPENARALSNKGNVLVRLEKSKEALVYFDKSLRIDPRNVIAWDKKGAVLYKFGRYEEAIECCDMALDFDRGYAPAWSNKGRALSKLERSEEAIGCFDRYLEFDPENVFVLIVKGQNLGNLGRYEEALRYVEKVLELNPTNAFAQHNKGFYLFKLAKDKETIKEAIKQYDKCLYLNPNYAPAWYNKGYALHRLGNDEEALECYDKALELGPDNVVTLDNKGYSLIKLRKYEEAIVCFNTALKKYPKFVKPWNNKGQTLGKLGRPEEGLECLDKALDLALNSGLDKSDRGYVASILDNKGYNLNELQRYGEAMECFDKALDFDRKYISAWQNKIYANLHLCRKEVSEKSIFKTSAIIFKEALSKVDNKEGFTAKIRKLIVFWFRDAIFEGYISSKEKLSSLLNEFEGVFEELGVKTPSLDDIKKVCEKTEKYEEYRDKIERIFG